MIWQTLAAATDTTNSQSLGDKVVDDALGEIVALVVGVVGAVLAFPVRQRRHRAEQRKDAAAKLQGWAIEVKRTRDELLRAAAEILTNPEAAPKLPELPAFPAEQLSQAIQGVDERAAYYALELDRALADVRWLLTRGPPHPHEIHDFQMRVAKVGVQQGLLEGALEHPLRRGEKWRPLTEDTANIRDTSDQSGAMTRA